MTVFKAVKDFASNMVGEDDSCAKCGGTERTPNGFCKGCQDRECAEKERVHQEFLRRHGKPQ